MADYVALLSKDPDSDYGVDFPDFPGCVTAGATQEEARGMAYEALCLHIEGMIADGEAIPEPSTAETVLANPDNANAPWFIVSIPDDVIRTMIRERRLPEGNRELIGADSCS